MKKQVFIGMLALTTTFTAGTAFAAPAAAKPVREMLVDYTKTIKEFAFGKGGSAAGLNVQQAKSAQDKLLNEIELPATAKAGLSLSLSAADKKASRLESLATIVAAKRMAIEISKSNAAEGKSISDAADASAIILSNAAMTGARKSTTLDQAQSTVTTAALSKAETLPEAILTSFSKAERDSYTVIFKKTDEIANSGKNVSYEDAFIEAIMVTKNVSKEEALKIAQKLKDCV